jgi:hypothetical protein
MNRNKSRAPRHYLIYVLIIKVLQQKVIITLNLWFVRPLIGLWLELLNPKCGSARFSHATPQSGVGSPFFKRS